MANEPQEFHAAYNTGMSREGIEGTVVSIVREQKTLPDGPLDTSLPLNEAGIDSLDALNILFAIEEEFDISIPDDTARELRTIDDMVSAIESLLVSPAS